MYWPGCGAKAAAAAIDPIAAKPQKVVACMAAAGCSAVLADPIGAAAACEAFK